MKVLHVHSGNLFGGVERVLLSLAAVAARSEMNHEYALCFAGAVAEQLRAKGAQVHWVGEVRTRRPWTVLAARHRLRELLRAKRFDAVIVHSPWAQAVFGGTIRQSRIPQVFWIHDVIDGRHWLQRWARASRPDLVLCSSRFLAAAVPFLYHDMECEVVYCPLDHVPDSDPETRRNLREASGVASDEVIIIQVGRMERWKGHTLLLKALGELRELPGWTCWQVGGAQRPEEGRYLQQLEDLTKKLGIGDRVDFLGFRSDVSQLLASADIFCQPNLAPEPFGLTFIEAMHAGLPVVTSSFGGGAEVVDGYGWLVEPGDPVQLAETLRRLILEPDVRAGSASERRARARALTDPVQQSNELARVLSRLTARTTID